MWNDIWFDVVKEYYFYAFDLGFSPHITLQRIERKALRAGWATRIVHDLVYLDFGGLHVQVDANGFGVLVSTTVKDQLILDYARERLRRLSYSVEWRRRGLVDSIIRRFALQPMIGNMSCMPSLMITLFEAECESMLAYAKVGKVNWKDTRLTGLLRSRMARACESSLFSADSSWFEQADMVLDRTDAILNGFYRQADRDTRRASDFMVFLVAVATMIPVLFLDWNHFSLTGYRVLGFVLVSLFALYFMSWRR